MASSKFAPIRILGGTRVGSFSRSRSAPSSFAVTSATRFGPASTKARMGVVSIVGMAEVERALAELVRLTGSGGMTAMIGTDLVDPPYPFYLEYGTSRMPARPSARPALDEMRETAIRTTGNVMGQLIVDGQRDPATTLRPALREGARPIENRWKELAPYLTGTYRRSIHTEVVEGT